MSAEPLPEIRSLHAILREFVTHVVEGEDEINSQEVVAYAYRRFAGDEEFKAAAVRDVIATVVPEILRDVIMAMRRDVVRTPQGAVSRKKIDLTARERLSSVFEGTGKGYKTFLALRKRELLNLNERDERDINTRLQWVGLRGDFAERMDDVRTVGDTFSSVELDVVWRRHFEPKSE